MVAGPLRKGKVRKSVRRQAVNGRLATRSANFLQLGNSAGCSTAVRKHLPALVAFGTAVVWGVNFPFLKIGLAEMSPLAFLFGRYLIMLVIAWVVLAWQRRRSGHSPRSDPADLPRPAPAGHPGPPPTLLPSTALPARPHPGRTPPRDPPTPRSRRLNPGVSQRRRVTRPDAPDDVPAWRGQTGARGEHQRVGGQNRQYLMVAARQEIERCGEAGQDQRLPRRPGEDSTAQR